MTHYLSDQMNVKVKNPAKILERMSYPKCLDALSADPDKVYKISEVNKIWVMIDSIQFKFHPSDIVAININQTQR